MKSGTGWFENAKYGLFIHWGLYAIPAGEWNGEPAPHGTEWLMKNLRVPLRDYRRLAERFDPTGFDARKTVRLAKSWGMKYLVFTAKHHDGFAMWDTKVSGYSSARSPAGRDFVRELADACREEDLPFCLYYSQMQDWEHPDGNGNTWDYDPAAQVFERYFSKKVLPQVRELLTDYGKIGMMWFDTPYDMKEELCRQLRDCVRECQPDCLVNGRIGYGLGDFREAADNAIPARTLNEVWEAPMTLNHTWGYSRRDADFKSPAAVIANLVRVAEKGGNLLLNVGPDAHGVIPEASVSVLSEVGAWLAENGASIYGTHGTPDFPYLNPWGGITYAEREQTLYLHVQKYPLFPYRILLTGLRTKALSATLLRDGRELKFTQSYEPARDEHRLYVFLPEICPDPRDTVVAVKLAGAPDPQKI